MSDIVGQLADRFELLGFLHMLLKRLLSFRFPPAVDGDGEDPCERSMRPRSSGV